MNVETRIWIYSTIYRFREDKMIEFQKALGYPGTDVKNVIGSVVEKTHEKLHYSHF